MSELSWAQTVHLVHHRAQNCCEYCGTCQKVCGQAMHVEHIDPSQGDDPQNLCLACASCNLSKGEATSAVDSVTQVMTPLFNPRQHRWIDHFRWVEGGTIVIGTTSIERVTVERLKMNLERIVTARRIWIKAGEHPPSILLDS